MYYSTQVNVPRRKTKREIESMLCYVTGMDYYTTRFEKLDEQPIAWKHSCAVVGVQLYKPVTYFFEDGDRVDYIYCHGCRKIIYFPHN